jgi:NAD+ diphosphatase
VVALGGVSRSYVYCPHCAGPLTPAGSGRARARCPACGFAHYDNPVPVVSAVVEHDGRVVLARNKAWPPTWYALVAGFLERDEAPDDAVRREVKEELGLDALSTQLIGIYPFPRMNQVIMAYHVTATGPITLNEELVDYRLVEPADCTAWRAGTGWALRDWLRSRGFEPRMTDRPGEGDIQEER